MPEPSLELTDDEILSFGLLGAHDAIKNIIETIEDEPAYDANEAVMTYLMLYLDGILARIAQLES